jgi:hypothetical protein
MLRETVKASIDKNIDLANDLAGKLLNAGGREILEKIKKEGF